MYRGDDQLKDERIPDSDIHDSKISISIPWKDTERFSNCRTKFFTFEYRVTILCCCCVYIRAQQVYAIFTNDELESKIFIIRELVPCRTHEKCKQLFLVAGIGGTVQRPQSKPQMFQYSLYLSISTTTQALVSFLFCMCRSSFHTVRHCTCKIQLRPDNMYRIFPLTLLRQQ